MNHHQLIISIFFISLTLQIPLTFVKLNIAFKCIFLFASRLLTIFQFQMTTCDNEKELQMMLKIIFSVGQFNL